MKLQGQRVQKTVDDEPGVPSHSKKHKTKNHRKTKTKTKQKHSYTVSTNRVKMPTILLIPQVSYNRTGEVVFKGVLGECVTTVRIEVVER